MATKKKAAKKRAPKRGRTPSVVGGSLPMSALDAGLKLGRPYKLEPERFNKIVELVRAGNYLVTAAGMSGCGKSAVYRWLAAGRRAERNGESGVLRDFYVAIMAARSEAEARSVERISAAGAKDWRAEAFLLERRSPERWGKREGLELTGNVKKPVATMQGLTITVVEARRVNRDTGDVIEDPAVPPEIKEG